MLLLLFQHGHLLFDGVALPTQIGHLFTLWVGAAFDFSSHLLADPISLGLERAALFFKIALLLGDQLQLCEIDGLASSPQFSGDLIWSVTHKALVKHGSGGNSAGSLWQSPSEHLADHHCGDRRKNGDAKGCERVLTLGNGNCGDHPCTEAGNAQLTGEIVGSLQGLLSR